MKKLLTILTIAALTTTSLFAMVEYSGKSAEIQLNSSIEETQVTYELAYDNYVFDEYLEGLVIDVKPLTEDDETKDFTVNATSNMNSDLNVSVTIEAYPFFTFINDFEYYESGITPQVNTKDQIDILEAGKHDNLLVNRFNLSWEGDPDLPAGDYMSFVFINYSIM